MFHHLLSPSSMLNLLHRKALRSVTGSRLALSNTHYRIYLLWKVVHYLYSGLLILRLFITSVLLLLLEVYHLKCPNLSDKKPEIPLQLYTQLDPVLGSLVEDVTLSTEGRACFRFLNAYSCPVGTLLSAIALYLDVSLHFRLDLFTTQLFTEIVNLNGVHFFRLNGHLRRPRPSSSFGGFFASSLGERLSLTLRWARKLWNFRSGFYCQFYFRRLRKFPHLSRAVRVKVLLLVMVTEKLVVASVLTTLIACSALTWTYLYELYYHQNLIYFNSESVIPPFSTLIVVLDVLLLSFTVFNASRTFKFTLFYLYVTFFANDAHQSENQLKLRQLVVHCRYRNTSSVNDNASHSSHSHIRSATISTLPAFTPTLTSSNSLIYSQNLAACLVFYYQERLFFLYSCLRLDRGALISGLLSASTTGSLALGGTILATVIYEEHLSTNRKLFLIFLFALQKVAFSAALTLCSRATECLHSSGRLLYTAQLLLRPRANVVAVQSKLKLMTRFELVHTKRPFTFTMFARAVSVRRQLLYECSFFYTAFLCALFKLINKRRLADISFEDV